MLIKLGLITLNTDDIRLIVPGAEKTTVFLSTSDGGRTASLDPASAEKLDLFLKAHGRFDLDGPAFKREVFEEAARLRVETTVYETLNLVLNLNAALENSKARLAEAARVKARPSPAVQQNQTPAPAPPSLPNLDADDPDPMTFVRRGPRLVNPAIEDL